MPASVLVLAIYGGKTLTPFVNGIHHGESSSQQNPRSRGSRFWSGLWENRAA